MAGASPSAAAQEIAISARFLIWVLVALLAAACWGAIVVLNKKVLDYVQPVAVNLGVLLVCAAGLAAVAVPLSLLHLWPLGLGLTWQAAGYIAINAPVTWVVAFSAYYYALRSGRAGVVGTLSSTDPLFTGLFATVLVGTALGGLTVAGMVLTVLGVVLISRWMGEEPEPHAPVLEGAITPAATGTAATVVALSLVTAAGWGLSPVLVQLAERSTGGPTTTMMLLSEGFGIALLAPFVATRRGALIVGSPDERGRRRIIALLVAAGLLNAAFSVLYYVLIFEIGPVLTMVTTATAPVFAIAGSVLVLHERFGRRLVLAAAVTLLGVLLATMQHPM